MDPAGSLQACLSALDSVTMVADIEAPVFWWAL